MKKSAVILLALAAIGVGVAVAAPTGSASAQAILSQVRIALNTRPDWFSELHSKFTPALLKLLAYAQGKGYTVTITSALRRGDTGYHGLGAAVDLNLSKGGDTWGMNVGRTSVADWLSTGIPQEAERLGMRWGGRFTKTDVVHFDAGGAYSKEDLS